MTERVGKMFRFVDFEGDSRTRTEAPPQRVSSFTKGSLVEILEWVAEMAKQTPGATMPESLKSLLPGDRFRYRLGLEVISKLNSVEELDMLQGATVWVKGPNIKYFRYEFRYPMV